MSLNQVTSPLHTIYAPFVSVPDVKDIVELGIETLGPTQNRYVKDVVIRSHSTSLGKKHTIFCNAIFKRSAVASVDEIPIVMNITIPGFRFPTGQFESVVVEKNGIYPVLVKNTDAGLFMRSLEGTNKIRMYIAKKAAAPAEVSIKDNNDNEEFKLSFTLTAVSA